LPFDGMKSSSKSCSGKSWCTQCDLLNSNHLLQIIHMF
jgi:hypothetical protein